MRSPRSNRCATGWLILVVVATTTQGCTTVKTTGTARTGTEQLLLTGAWDSTLCRVDFRPLAGMKVFLDDKYITVVDKDWVISSIHRALARQGVLLESNRDHAQVIVEPSLGAYGTDDRTCTSGLPQLGVLPSLLGVGAGAAAGGTTASTTTSSSLNLTQTTKQDAVVKAAFFAYEAKTGRMIWESGPLLNVDGYRDRFIMGTGPYRVASNRPLEVYPDQAQSRVKSRPWKSTTR